MSHSNARPPVEDLWDKYSYNPFTGTLHSKKTGKRIQGNKVTNKWGNTNHLITLYWNSMQYKTSYGRVVFAFITGNWPIQEIDHIDRNPFNNKPWNLREVTSRQSIQNRGNFGGTWVARHQKWQAQIRIQGKVKWLGYHSTKEKAMEAYWKAVEHYGLDDIRTLQDSHS